MHCYLKIYNCLIEFVVAQQQHNNAVKTPTGNSTYKHFNRDLTVAYKMTSTMFSKSVWYSTQFSLNWKANYNIRNRLMKLQLVSSNFPSVQQVHELLVWGCRKCKHSEVTYYISYKNIIFFNSGKERTQMGLSGTLCKQLLKHTRYLIKQAHVYRLKSKPLHYWSKYSSSCFDSPWQNINVLSCT